MRANALLARRIAAPTFARIEAKATRLTRLTSFRESAPSVAVLGTRASVAFAMPVQTVRTCLIRHDEAQKGVL